MLELASARASVAVDPERGGRIASLRIDGFELLVGEVDDDLAWGCYPMVPFAGRIRRGRFGFDGTDHRLPPNLGIHAIHGYGFTSAWELAGPGRLEWEFTRPWPFRGSAVQQVALGDHELVLAMTIHARDRQPVMGGWHPWFRREIGARAPVEVIMPDARMYELDSEAIPTGRLVEPPPGPWDNCFTNLSADPVLVWGDEVQLELSSTADHWVVFTEPAHAVCVEPQTGAPDEVNREPVVLESGEQLRVDFTLRW